MKKKTYFLVEGALIAAIYAGFTYFMGFWGLAYGPIQFRISEALTILPVFTSAAIPGLTVGCLIANIGSLGSMPFDMIFGTAATLLSAVFTYLFKNIKFKNIPILSIICPIIFNSLIVGAEITIFMSESGASLTGFVLSALSVAAGEAAVCLGLGIPLYFIINNNKDLRDLITYKS